MKFKMYLVGLGLMTSAMAKAQMTDNISTTPSPTTQAYQKFSGHGKKGCLTSKMNVSLSAGIANYYGDLTENFHLFNQSSYSLGVGVTYPVIPHVNLRADLAFMQVGAKDSKNKRADLQARNLSFKSAIWDLSLALELDALNMEKHKFSPYIFGGFGAFYFNPYAKDATGHKVFLQYLGTEGQGLAAYPDRKFYKRVEFEIPFGGGLKWKATKNVTLQLEFKYRKTNTDYIDDVSRSGYASKTLLDARDPRSAMMAWRGGEVGAGPYPTNPNLNRGNPKNKDAFYTTQFKVTFHPGCKKAAKTGAVLPATPSLAVRN